MTYEISGYEMSEPITNRVECPSQPRTFKQVIRDFAEDAAEFCVYTIPGNIRRFFANVYRVCRWIPVIWNDRDYDSYFFYKIVQFKIQQILKSSEQWNWQGKEKQQAVLQKINCELDYFTERNDCLYPFARELAEQHKNEYGQLVCWSTPIENSKNYRAHIAFDKAFDQQTADAADQAYDRLNLINDSRRIESNRLIWKLISDNVHKWWD